MASSNAKRRPRKRRQRGAAARPAPSSETGRATPRAEHRPPRADSRPPRADRRPPGAAQELGFILTGRTYGERPANPFAPIPASEIAIFAGAVGALVGWISHSSTTLVVGIVVCALGVIEVTAREHFSGYRSHATLLAAIPAGGILIASAAAFGTPHQRSTRELMLLAALPVFALLFWLLRKRFLAARQTRIVRPPGT